MPTKLRNGYNYDSFDRFGDDLCELLLSYLTICDKLCFECVSKQWKRLIYNKLQKLFICFNFSSDLLIKKIPNRRTPPQSVANHAFEKFMQNIIFINEIVICNAINAQIVSIINSNYSQDMNQINLFVDIINGKNNLIFGTNGEIFLQNVVLDSVRINTKVLVKLFAKCHKIKLILCTILSPITEQFMSKLSEISFRLSIVNSNELKSFSNLYCKQINKLKITLSTTSISASNGDLNAMLKQISNFENLEILVLNIKSTNNLSPIDSGLAMIANNCKKLVFLEIAVNLLGNKYKIIENLFEIMQKFNALKGLQCIDNSFAVNYGDIKLLENSKSLVHLSLSVNSLTDKRLEDIHLYLPQLKRIIIDYDYDIITYETLENLVKIENLDLISIYNNSLFDSNVNELIDTLIKTSRRNSKILFFWSLSHENGWNFRFYSIPPNLKIKYNNKMI